MPIQKINHELHMLKNSGLPPLQQQWVKGVIYKKLTPTKRRKLSNHFGQTSPATQAAITQAAATQAVTQAAVSSAAVVSAAAATQAAPAVADSIGFGLASTAPMYAQPTQMVQQAPVTQMAQVAGTVSTGDYNSAAGAIQGAEFALQNAAQQLTAARGISGYGNKIKNKKYYM
jgi:hypothetical protein